MNLPLKDTVHYHMPERGEVYTHQFIEEGLTDVVRGSYMMNVNKAMVCKRTIRSCVRTLSNMASRRGAALGDRNRRAQSASYMGTPPSGSPGTAGGWRTVSRRLRAAGTSAPWVRARAAPPGVRASTALLSQRCGVSTRASAPENPLWILGVMEA